jgi:succinate dehydrogenase hydrophobic anchor subunit
VFSWSYPIVKYGKKILSFHQATMIKWSIAIKIKRLSAQGKGIALLGFPFTGLFLPFEFGNLPIVHFGRFQNSPFLVFSLLVVLYVSMHEELGLVIFKTSPSSSKSESGCTDIVFFVWVFSYPIPFRFNLDFRIKFEWVGILYLILFRAEYCRFQILSD